MPLYVYKCPACGLQREEMRTVAERDVLPCCNGTLMEVAEPIGHELEVMQRVITAAAFHVKGYAARNNYSKLDTGWQGKGSGIRTRVTGDHIDIEGK
jgi:putative FmdB family regulatory protein